MKWICFRRYFAALSLSLPLSVWCHPQGCHLRSGTVEFVETDSATFTVHSADRTILEWDHFSIGSGETTHFVLPTASSSILNRVIGNSLTEIYGSLRSNGQVFLINPKGIIFGEGAIVETASFFASTLDALDADFLRGGDICFFGDSQEPIVNLGTISASCGDVALIACHIEHQGLIEAKKGTASLAAGTHVFLAPASNPRILIRPDLSNREILPVGIDNQGRIEALQVELKADGNPYQLAIKDRGAVDALAFQGEGGRLFLVAESGRVDLHGKYTASNPCGKGGSAQFLGKELFVCDSTCIDVSGTEGGGKVFIGGDYQGKNPEIPNAEVIYFSPEATICANASVSGDGGRVILWGDRANEFFGTISVQGGPIGGNGGFVEVSSPGYLNFDGFVDRSALFGSAGTLLLDPCTVIISSSPNSGATFTAGMPGTYMFSGMSATINATTLGTNLNNGPVLIDATASGSALVANITVNNNVTWSAPHALTLKANNMGSQITMNAQILPTNATMATTDLIVSVQGGDLTIGSMARTHAPACGIEATSGKVEINVAQLAIYGGQSNGNSSGMIAGGSVNILNADNITMQGGLGGGCLAIIFTQGSGGNDITVVNQGNYSILGGDASGNSGFVANAGFYSGYTSGSGNITLSGGSYTLTGGIGIGTSRAEISAKGTINITGSSDLSMIGGSGLNSASRISTDAFGGDITCNIGSGNYNMQAGMPPLTSGDSSVGFYTGISSGSTGNITLIGAAYTLVGGGGGNSFAKVSAIGTIDITGSANMMLTGGNSGQNSPAQIITNAVGGDITCDIGSGNYIFQGGTSGNSGSDNRAGIYTGLTSGNGNITVNGGNYQFTGGFGTHSGPTGGQIGAVGTIMLTGSGDISLNGGVGINAPATIFASTQSGAAITSVIAGDYNITGGSGNSSSAQITALGLVTLNGNNATLTGGSSGVASGSDAIIQSTGVGGSVVLTLTGDLELNGGTAPNQHSYIQTTATSGSNPVTITASFFTLNGSMVANSASAEIVTKLGVITLNTQALPPGSLTLTANMGGALIHTTSTAPASPVISIGQTNPFTFITMLGGSGTSARALISTDAGGDIIATTTGDYTITGGSSASTTPGGSAGFVTASPGGNITLIGNDYILTGGALGAGTNLAEISAFGDVLLTGVNATLTGGSGTSPSGSDATIKSTAPNRSVTIGSTMTPFTTVVLNGGTASNQNSYIQTTAATGTNLITIYADALTLNGSMTATGASAGIVGNVGSIDIIVSGAVTLNGGAAMDAAARIATTRNTDTITITPASLLLQGGSADGALAEIASAGGQIFIDWNSMGLGTFDLLAAGGDAIIHSTAAAGINPVISIGQTTPFASMNMAGGNGAVSARAFISTDAGGDIISTTAGDYTITGGGSAGTMPGGSAGFVTASPGGNITLIANNYILTGGALGAGTNLAEISAFGEVLLTGVNVTLTGGSGTSPSGSDAIIESTAPNGNVMIGSTMTPFTTVVLNGGTASDQNSYIQTTAATGTNLITIYADALTLNGSMTATGASAGIVGDVGSIDIIVSGAVTLNGGAAMDAAARIATTSNMDTITITPASLLLQGGSADGAAAEIASAGGQIFIDWNSTAPGTIDLVADVADAIIHSTAAVGINPVISIGQTTPFASITMTGGNGAVSARAFISTDAGGDIISTITGDYTITGGGSAGTMPGGSAGFVTASPGGNITLIGNDYILTGGALGAGTNLAEISAFGDVLLTGVNVTLTGGSGTSPSGSDAIIESTAPNGSVTLGSTMTPFTTVVLNGGTASNQNSYIQTTAATGTNLITIYADALALNGSMTATGASAGIVGDVGSIDIIVSGAVTLNGGAAMDAAARIATTSNTDTITITPASLLLQGGSADGALAEIASAGGQIFIDWNSTAPGTIQLLADVADAIIHSTAAAGINPVISIGQTTPFASITMTGGNGAVSARAFISTDAGGDIISTITGDYTITGGGSAGTMPGGSAGFVTASPGGNITLIGNDYILTGGALGAGTNLAEISAFGDVLLTGVNATLIGGSGTSPSGSDAIIESTAPNGSVAIGSMMTPFTTVVLNGGTASDQNSYIQTTAATGTNLITIYADALTLNGSMTATGASAGIVGDVGSIDIIVSGAVTLNGGAAMDAAARIGTTSNTDTITITPASLLLQGGSADGAKAEIASAGGQIFIDWNSTGPGTLDLLAAGADAIIHSTAAVGTNPVISIGQTTPFASINMTGGNGAVSARALISTDTGGNIVSTITGNYTIAGGTSAGDGRAGFYAGLVSGVGDVTLNGHDYFLLGGPMGGTGTNIAAISASEDVLLTGHDCSVTGGAGAMASGSDALIESKGVNGSVVLRFLNDVVISGGNIGQSGLIQTTSGMGSNPITIFSRRLDVLGGMAMNASAQIVTNQGSIRLVVLNRINVIGGTASGANALVHSTGQGNLFVRSVNLNATGGVLGTQTGFYTPMGNINMLYAGHCLYDASLGGQALLQTLNGDLFVTAVGYIDLSGNTLASDGGAGKIFRMIAGTNMSIGSGTQVIGNGSSLVLVVDERYPIPPLHGPGAFNLDVGATLSAGVGVPVRIFTSEQGQNSINALINGMAYVPGTQGVDTQTERWGVYFPNSFYGTMVNFTLFYKSVGPPPPPPPSPPLTPTQQAVLLNFSSLLARAAFVDSEGLFDLANMDQFIFDDAFNFSTFLDCWKFCARGGWMTQKDVEIISPRLEDERERGLSIRRRRNLGYHDVIR